MAKFIRLAVFFLLLANPLFSAVKDDSSIDIQKGNEAYAENDYYSALVFYARAMGSQEITDGIIWYKTAYSYEKIKGQDDLLKALYTISFYYLIQTQPDHSYIDILKTRLDQSLKINSPFIKKTRLELASRMLETGTGTKKVSFAVVKEAIRGWYLFFKDSILSKWEHMLLPWKDFQKAGVVSGIRSLFQNWEVLLLGWVLICFPTGILLPFILANYRSSRGKQKGLAESYLLWFHWGFFGIHRFYLGQYGMGLFLLLTFGGLGIGWVIEGVLLTSNFRKVGGSGSTRPHRVQVGGSHGRSQVQATKQVSRRKPAEDTFDDFNLLSSGEEL